MSQQIDFWLVLQGLWQWVQGNFDGIIKGLHFQDQEKTLSGMKYRAVNSLHNILTIHRKTNKYAQ